MVCPSCNAPVMAHPISAYMMESMMRGMMNGMMKISGTDGDPTQAEVSNFMVPKLFDPADAEKYASFLEQRPYCVPGYEVQAPQPGNVVPDGPLLPLVGGAETTLLTEARALAAKHGTSKVVISFDSVTCPFWRAYAAKDLFKAAGGVPTLHVYIREAHPMDEFNAAPNGTGPLSLARTHNKHQTIEDRRQSAQEALGFIRKWEPEAVMFVDGMDDALEAMYEARPWRQYVIEAETGVMVDAIGLTPFNMSAKIAVIKAATEGI